MTDLSKRSAVQPTDRGRRYLPQRGDCCAVNQSPAPCWWPALPGQCRGAWFDTALVTHLPNSVFPNWSHNQTSVQSVSHKVLLLIISSFLYHPAVKHCYQFVRNGSSGILLTDCHSSILSICPILQSKPRNFANSAAALRLYKAL